MNSGIDILNLNWNDYILPEGKYHWLAHSPTQQWTDSHSDIQRL